MNEPPGPSQNPPQNVPYAKRDALKAELMRMCELNVLAPVQEPTEWVNSMAIAYKANGSLRICIDPKYLNCAIHTEHYPMQTLEDIVSRMPKVKIFTKVDAKSGYWQLRLPKRSSMLTTFNTPFGRFRLRESGLKLNLEKSLFSVPKVEFPGNIVSGNALEPTNDHMSSVLDMPEPRNKN